MLVETDVVPAGSAGEVVGVVLTTWVVGAEVVLAVGESAVVVSRLLVAEAVAPVSKRVVLVAVLGDPCAIGAVLGLEGRNAAGCVEGVAQLGAVGPGDGRVRALTRPSRRRRLEPLSAEQSASQFLGRKARGPPRK